MEDQAFGKAQAGSDADVPNVGTPGDSGLTAGPVKPRRLHHFR